MLAAYNLPLFLRSNLGTAFQRMAFSIRKLAARNLLFVRMSKTYYPTNVTVEDPFDTKLPPAPRFVPVAKSAPRK